MHTDPITLTADGRWSYEWDAENRLKAMQTLPAAADAGVPAQRLEFAYDAQSRRIRKAVYQLETLNLEPETWVLKQDLRYLYDGWNVVAEFNLKPETSNLELVRSYAWGIDLSGTEQGAGGVGGLLLVHQTDLVLAPCYDGNGNITAYVNLENAAVLAKFDYDPFGKPVWTELSGTGELPPFRFSTKYEDAETGLVYYGFRYYSPELGRWINRDPIEERGGLNLYGMVGNDAVNLIDKFGLQSSSEWLREMLKIDSIKNKIGVIGEEMSIASYIRSRFDVSTRTDPRVQNVPGSYETALNNFLDYQYEYGARICMSKCVKVYAAEIKRGEQLQIFMMMLPPCKEGDMTVGFSHNHPNRNGGISPGDASAASSLRTLNKLQFNVDFGWIFVAYSRDYPFKKGLFGSEVKRGDNTPPTKYQNLTTEYYNGNQIIPIHSNVPFLFPYY